MTMTWIRMSGLALALALAFPMLAAGNGGSAKAVSSATLISVEQLEERARSAKTPAEHLAVADSYEQLSREQGERAARHEKEAERLTPRGYNPMMQKWPGLALGPANRERARAMQARRAASEATQLAELHRQRAREAAGVAAAAE